MPNLRRSDCRRARAAGGRPASERAGGPSRGFPFGTFRGSQRGGQSASCCLVGAGLPERALLPRQQEDDTDPQCGARGPPLDPSGGFANPKRGPGPSARSRAWVRESAPAETGFGRLSAGRHWGGGQCRPVAAREGGLLRQPRFERAATGALTPALAAQKSSEREATARPIRDIRSRAQARGPRPSAIASPTSRRPRRAAVTDQPVHAAAPRAPGPAPGTLGATDSIRIGFYALAAASKRPEGCPTAPALNFPDGQAAVGAGATPKTRSTNRSTRLARSTAPS